MRIILGLAGIVLASIIAVAFAYPAAAAVTCPSCFGFTALGGNLFVEATMTAPERAQASAHVDAARRRVSAFYGRLEGDPRILVCATAGCYGKMGGGSRGMAIFDVALILAPGGDNTVIAAHELSHIELHRRIGRWNTFEKVVPQWFDEGLAVVVSGDPRYLKPEGMADRCTGEPIADLPVSRGAWIASVMRDDLYPKAACRVLRWMNARGGPVVIDRLADAVSEGADFATASR